MIEDNPHSYIMKGYDESDFESTSIYFNINTYTNTANNIKIHINIM